MSGWNSFGKSLLFALLAASCFPLFALAMSAFGGMHSFSLYFVLATSVYLCGLGRHRPRSLAAGVVTAACGLGALMAGATLVEVSLLLAALLGIFRSGLLFHNTGKGGKHFGRAFAIEVTLLGAGLGLTFFLLDYSILSQALALWGFFLVQSAYLLIGGEWRREENEAVGDPFGRACARAYALMDR